MKWLFQSTAIILTGILNNSQDLTVYIPLSRQLIHVNTVGSRLPCLTGLQKKYSWNPILFFPFTLSLSSVVRRVPPHPVWYMVHWYHSSWNSWSWMLNSENGRWPPFIHMYSSVGKSNCWLQFPLRGENGSWLAPSKMSNSALGLVEVLPNLVPCMSWLGVAVAWTCPVTLAFSSSIGHFKAKGISRSKSKVHICRIMFSWQLKTKTEKPHYSWCKTDQQRGVDELRNAPASAGLMKLIAKARVASAFGIAWKMLVKGRFFFSAK